MTVVHMYIKIIMHAHIREKQNFAKLHSWQEHLHSTRNCKAPAADVFQRLDHR